MDDFLRMVTCTLCLLGRSNSETGFIIRKGGAGLCTRLKWDLISKQHIKQVIRSGGSFTANYIEASDDLGSADERVKLKLSRKEAKETIKWLGILLTYDDYALGQERLRLPDEGEQLRKILSAKLKSSVTGHRLCLVSCTLPIQSNITTSSLPSLSCQSTLTFCEMMESMALPT